MSKGSNTLNQQTAKPSRSVLFGAAFLMATSATVSYTHLTLPTKA